MINRGQYGSAAPSSLGVTAHPEDSQPNEKINSRNGRSRHINVPPRVAHSSPGYKGNRGGAVGFLGGSRGRGIQWAKRGSWRGRGASQGSKPYGRNMDRTSKLANPTVDNAASSPSSLPSRSKPANVHYPANNHQLVDQQMVPPVSAPTSSSSMNGNSHSWLTRSRSPTPKLPTQPLKRRKFGHGHDRGRVSQAEIDATDIPQPTGSSSELGFDSNSMPPPCSTLRPIPPGGKREADDSSSSSPAPCQKKAKDEAASAPSLLHSSAAVKSETIQTTFEHSPSQTSPASLSTPTVDSAPITHDIVKHESRSPTPVPLPPPRRLVTSSCSLFPLPDDCKKPYYSKLKPKPRPINAQGMTEDNGAEDDMIAQRLGRRGNPNFYENRRSFAREKNRELQLLGLKRTNAMIREDGLVIEWTSAIPVWSDTLRPEVPSLAETMSLSQKLNKPSPKSPPNLKRKRSTPSTRSSSLSASETRDVQVIDVDALPSPPLPPTGLGGAGPVVFRKKRTPSSSTSRDGPASSLSSFAKAKGRMSAPSSMSVPLAAPSSVRSRSPSSAAPSSSTPLLPTRSHSYTPQSTVSSLVKTRTEQSHTSQEETPARPVSLPLPTRRRPLPTRQNGPAHTATASSNPSGSNTSTSNTSTSSASTPGSKATAGTLSALKGTDLAKKSLSSIVPPDNDSGQISVKRELEEGLRGLTPERVGKQVDSVALSLSGEDEDLIDSPEYDLAIKFLSNYTSLFDADRPKLEMAYAKDALFSCRVHHLKQPSLSMAGLFAPEPKSLLQSSHSRASASTVSRGRTQIVNRLLELGNYGFCPRGVPRTIYYDLAALSRKVVGIGGPAAATAATPTNPVGAGGMLVTLHAEVVNPNMEDPKMDHILTLDQSLVLRRRVEGDDDENDDRNATRHHKAWPLVAVSHQMTVREGPLLPAERLERILPWMEDMT